MVVRATEAEIDVVRKSPDDAIVVFEESVLPALRDQDGYQGCYVLLSEEGKMLVLTFWEDRQAARETRRSGFYEEQVAKFTDLVLYRQEPGREMYDVVVAEAPQAAVA
jgi:heme-degrading monooxygenase HmoA